MNLKEIFFALLMVSLIYFGHSAVKYWISLKNQNARLHQDLISQKDAFQKLSEYSAKLEAEYVTQKELRTRLESEFAREKEALKGRIKLLSNATFLIRQRARKSANSDISYRGGRFGFLVNELRYSDGPPLGYVLIFDDGRVISKLYSHRIVVKTAISRDENLGKYSVVSKADYVLISPSINLNGEKNWFKKPYPLKIFGGKATIDPTEPNHASPQFHWWAPHINGGLSVGADQKGVFVRPTVGVSLMGYGPSKNDLDWKFLHLGVDTDTSFTAPGIHFIPFSYRFLPSVLTNTYVGPGIGWSSQGWNTQLNLNVTF